MEILSLVMLFALSAAAASPITMTTTGTVDVRNTAAESWKAITGPQNLAEGMQVRTHKLATAEISFADGSKVQLAPFTIFTIDKTDKSESRFSLPIGSLRAAFAGLLSSRITIHTPTAVCAVRGTVFDIGADSKGTQVNMAEGVLEVKDNKGQQAVVTSEETMRIGDKGIEKPHMISLHDGGALPAVRPYAVHQEMARDATRRMLEDLRNRELKANEAQLGKDVVDAFGRRVRLEEYLLRPASNSFELLFLNQRQGSFNWGHYIDTFHGTLPNDLSQVPAIVASSILSPTKPSNWLTSTEFYATNTIDAEREVVTMGDPVQINFAGFNNGNQLLLWYPSSINFTQTLYGPGVPGGSRVQFIQTQDWNTTNANLLTWTQQVQAPAGAGLQTMLEAVLDPTNTTDVAAGATGIVVGGPGNPLYDATNTYQSTPGGPSKADLFSTTVYPDGSYLSVEKFLVSDDGKILDFANPTTSAFTQNGNYNLEISINSNLFQGRNIDVLLSPTILNQQAQSSAAGSNIPVP